MSGSGSPDPLQLRVALTSPSLNACLCLKGPNSGGADTTQRKGKTKYEHEPVDDNSKLKFILYKCIYHKINVHLLIYIVNIKLNKLKWCQGENQTMTTEQL